MTSGLVSGVLGCQVGAFRLRARGKHPKSWMHLTANNPTLVLGSPVWEPIKEHLIGFGFRASLEGIPGKGR